MTNNSNQLRLNDREALATLGAAAEHVNQFGDSLRDSFASRVGWRIEENWLYFRQLTFDACAPQGHLPSPSFAIPCNLKGGEEQEVLGRWCVAFCFGGIRCGVLFLGWWVLLSRPDLYSKQFSI